MTGPGQETLAVRGRFLDVTAVCHQPEQIEDRVRHLEDGLLLVEDGMIRWFGSWEESRDRIPPGCPVHVHTDKLIVPGFVDTHLHFPQADIVGSYGEQLLQWLERFAFPAESRCADPAAAGELAGFFLDQLLRNGTTTASVFCSVHPGSVETLFDAADRIGMRLIAGKVMMDRNVPAGLADSADSGYGESRTLIGKYHGRGRFRYAVTPRFAPSSSPGQLEAAGALKREFPDVHVQTHLSENPDEIAWVRKLFPDRKNYLDVYHHHGLTGPLCNFAHCLHLEDQEWERLAETDSVISFCPTSNLFLGSGLFDLGRARRHGIRVGVATDVGGGTSFSMLRTLGEAYKVVQLQGQKLTPWDAFYTATLGGARALSLDSFVGSFEAGKEADFVVLDPQATPLQARQYRQEQDPADLVFGFFVHGDDRSISHTYVGGRLVHERSGAR